MYVGSNCVGSKGGNAFNTKCAHKVAFKHGASIKGVLLDRAKRGHVVVILRDFHIGKP